MEATTTLTLDRRRRLTALLAAIATALALLVPLSAATPAHASGCGHTSHIHYGVHGVSSYEHHDYYNRHSWVSFDGGVTWYSTHIWDRYHWNHSHSGAKWTTVYSFPCSHAPH